MLYFMKVICQSQILSSLLLIMEVIPIILSERMVIVLFVGVFIFDNLAYACMLIFDNLVVAPSLD